MIRNYSFIKSWLKSFIFHGNFQNVPEEFDVIEEEIKNNDLDDNSHERTDPPIYSQQYTSKFEDPLLDNAYQLGKDDKMLELIRNSLKEIHEFERELDNSFNKINDKLDKKEYHYETNKSK